MNLKLSSEGRLPPQLTPSSPLSQTTSPLVRGVMWVQRERISSRWKERFFILTKDYLQCYKRGTSQATEMGPFLFQVEKLCTFVRFCETEFVCFRYG